MNSLGYLPDILILLTVSILNVLISRKLKLSPVLGYLVLGASIGEFGFNLIKEPNYAHNISEFGVVFLLFAIGLELTFERIINMRLLVFGFGGAQLIITSICFAFLLHKIFLLQISASILIGCALSLSSTAVVLQVLSENKRQSTQVGRISLSVLLMQDFAVVPLLAILPLLSIVDENYNILNTLGFAALKALIAIILITIAGRIFLRPFLSLIGSVKSQEVYVTTTLLIVLSSAMLTHELGLSTAMGAFIAGIFIAETEYRNRVELSIMPFKSLLLGLFFLSVGMSLDFNFILRNITDVLLACLVLLAIKGGIIYILCRLFKISGGASIHASLLICQGSEFAFILFSLAAKQNVMPESMAQFLLVVVALSMAITPLLSLIGVKLEDMLDWKEEKDKNHEFVGVTDLNSHIIIAGFGRVGRVIAYMLTQMDFNYIAIDSDLVVVKKARAKGFPVYHGDLSDMEVLQALGAERARCIVLTMNEKQSLRKAIKTIHSQYKDMEIISRAEDFRDGLGLKKLGATICVPSTIETGLQIGSSLLKNLGIAEAHIFDLKETFRNNDYSFTQDIELFGGIAPSKQTDS